MPDDLSAAYTSLKDLPDHALQQELSSPTGMIPGYMIVSELHERKMMRTGGGATDMPKSLAQEYMGDPGQRAQGYAGGGLVERGELTPQRQFASQPMDAGIASLGAIPGYAPGGIVALDRYNAHVDPRLYNILSMASRYSPYEVRLTSGFRGGDPRFHGKGEATDIQLVDPNTGKVMENYQSGQYFPEYQAFANQARAIQQQMYPELGDKFRWGGYFSGPKGKYGAMDLMHFDIGGVPTSGGSWEAGITPQQAALYGIRSNAPFASGMVTNASYDPYQTAFLNAVAGGESGGKYNIITGGQLFNDYSRHPNVRVAQPGGDFSTAAGRYQITNATYNEYAPKLGITDFNPASQDRLAWQLASDRYMKATGQDLGTVLRSGDPSAIANVGNALSPTWLALKGKDFTQLYNNALSQNANVAANQQVAASAANTATQAAATETGDPLMSLAVLSSMFGQKQAPPPQPVVGQPQQQEQPVDPFAVSPYPELLRQRQQRWGTLI